MQKSIEKNIKTTLKEAKDLYSKEIIKAVDMNSVEDIIEISNRLKSVNEALNLFENLSTDNHRVKNNGTKKTSKKSSNENAKTNKDTENSSKRGRKQNNTVTLFDNMTNKRPKTVMIEDNSFEVSSFRDVVRVVCSYIFEIMPDKMRTLENVAAVNGDEHQYFSLVQHPDNGLDEIVNSKNEKMYIDTAKLAVNNMFFLKKMMNVLNFDTNSITIKLDRDYQRKERTKKSKVPAMA